MWPQRRRHYGDVYAYMLAFQTAVQFLEQRRAPPVTLALVALNVAVHLRPGPVRDWLPPSNAVCLNPAAVWRTWDWRRILLSSFYHVDDTHLIYNMVSLLWKGMELESRQGSTRFAATTGALLLLCPGLFVLISGLLSDLLGFHDPWYRECAVGFSAVLFGYKTILNAAEPTNSYVGGVLLPTKYATWAEVILIQMLVPEASLVGHLCGILAGLILLYAPGGLSGSTLSFVPLRFLWGFGQRRVWGSGVSGRRQNHPPPQEPHRTPVGPTFASSSRGLSCPVCTFLNPAGVRFCGMCATALDTAPGSWHASHAPSAPILDENEIEPQVDDRRAVPADAELRRRRLSRFQ